MNLIDAAKARITGRNLRLVMPEGADQRIRDAAIQIEDERLAKVIVYGGQLPPPTAEHVSAVQSQRPKLTAAMAMRLLAKPLPRAAASVATGETDAMLAGVENTTAKVIEAALMTIGLAGTTTVPSSYFLMQWPDRQLIFADCAVNIAPTAEQLAEIAISTAKSAAAVLKDMPKLALLSFSTTGSARHGSIDKIVTALHIVRQREPSILIDGELQLDAAL
jgi:phosphotransacetylase